MDSFPRFVRAVRPARIPAQTKLFVATLVFVGVGMGAIVAATQQTAPPRSTLPEPLHRDLAQATALDLGRGFTISARVLPFQDSDRAHLVFGNEQVRVRHRGSAIEVEIYDWRGRSLRLASSTPVPAGRWSRVAVTRSVDRLSLWVNGNETRVEHDQRPTAQAGMFALGKWHGSIDNVIIWDQPLDAAQLAAIE